MADKTDCDAHIHIEQTRLKALQRLSELITARKEGDPFAPVTVVVPTQYAGVFLRRALAAERGLLNVRFMILPRLAEYLGSPSLATSGKVPLTSVVELAIIRHIATQIGQDGPIRAVANHPGLPSLLRDSFRALSRLDDNDLNTLAMADDIRSQLVEWYCQFRREIESYYVEEELILSAESAVTNRMASDVLRDIGFVIFYLPNDLTIAAGSLLKSLAETGRAAVILGLVGEREIDVDTISIATSISPNVNSILMEEDRTPALPAKLLCAPDAREEIRWLIRDIARRCEGGTPFRKIAVLYRSTEPYSSLIPAQLSLAGMPVAGPNRKPLKDSPSGRSLLGMLTSVNSDLSRSEVMQWLAETPVKIGSDDPDTRWTFAEWESVTRRAGIISGIEQWEKRLDALAGNLIRRIDMAEKLEETSLARLEGLRRILGTVPSLRKFIKEFSNLSSPPADSSWQDLAKWSKTLLVNYSFAEEDLPLEHLSAHERLEYLSAHERLLEILDEFGNLDATSIPASRGVFLEILEQTLEEPSGRFGETGSGIFVAPCSAIKCMDFEVVYFVGMCEGAFPAKPPQDSLIPYQVRKTIGDEKKLDTEQGLVRKERREFLNAISAGESYILSYPRSDSNSQRRTFPSAWFLDFLSKLNGDQVKSDDILSLRDKIWLEVLDSPLHSLKSVEAVAAADIHDRDVASVANWITSGRTLDTHYLVHQEGNFLSQSIALGKSRQSRRVTRWDGDVSNISGGEALLKQGPLSATGLENWARCPFSYFLGRVLGLRSLDAPEDVLSISAIDRGSMVHRILERIVDETIRQDARSISGSEQLQTVEKIAEEEFILGEERNITGKPLLWTTAKEEILRDLFEFIDEDRIWREEQGLTPIWTEQPFGFDTHDSLDPLEITLKDGTAFSFKGMIDRVDISEDRKRIFVTDYKTGSSSPYQNMNRDSLDNGRRLQIPIYALSAKQAFSEADQAQGAYWFVTTGGHFERKMVDLEEIGNRFNEVVGNITTGIQHGLFPANPGSPGQFGSENCRFCDFDRICPGDRRSLWEQKKDDPRLGSYMALYNTTWDPGIEL